MKKRLTQVQVLAKELAKRPLTGKQIENELGIMNYKGRIHDLRKILSLQQWPLWKTSIKSEKMKKKTRYGYSFPRKYYVASIARNSYKQFVKEFCK